VFHVRPIRCRTHDCFSYDGSNSDSRAAGCAASVATSQAPPSQAAPASAGQIAPAPSAQAIIVPTGTAVQLTLMSAVKSKSTKAGDTVRAVVAFP
jgi:hypothetical protein